MGCVLVSGYREGHSLGRVERQCRQLDHRVGTAPVEDGRAVEVVVDVADLLLCGVPVDADFKTEVHDRAIGVVIWVRHVELEDERIPWGHCRGDEV